MSGAAIACAFFGAQPAIAQTPPTLTVVYVQCQPDPVVHPDGSQTSFYNNGTYSRTNATDGKVNGLAAATTTTAGKVTLAPDVPFLRGSAALVETYKIAYPAEARPRFEREFKSTFRAPEGAGVKAPIMLSYFSGGTLLRQSKARASAASDIRFVDTIPDAEFVRLQGPVKVTIDAEGGAKRLAEIEFAVPVSRTKAVYDSSFKPVTVQMIASGTVPAGCTRNESSHQGKS
ncbi:MAG: hypothetical protein EOP60_10720 [Sphingomonadales bacterium]|nr:MAG: hypothetical protein EOP60_10720 [Sphingomonadales bacterium]